jgi:hypothetical protein
MAVLAAAVALELLDQLLVVVVVDLKPLTTQVLAVTVKSSSQYSQRKEKSWLTNVYWTAPQR